MSFASLVGIVMLPASAVRAAEEPVARVGNVDINAGEIRDYLRSLTPAEQAALERDPTLLNQTVRSMLARRLVLQEARDAKWDQQPAVVAQLDRVREDAMIESYLQARSEAPKDFPAAADVQAAYEVNKNAFVVPKQLQLSQIFVAVPQGTDRAADDKARKEIEEMQKKLNQKDAVVPWSDLGWLAEQQINPRIGEKIVTLPKGGTSGPVRLDDGWHIVKVVDIKASYTRPLDEVRPQLVAQMRAERAAANRRAILAQMLEQHPPAVNELALSKLLTERERAAQAK
jgi:peptidylprolyl isomerase